MFFQKVKYVALILSIILGICITSSLSEVESSVSGIKLTLKEDMIQSLKSKFLPKFLPKLGNFTVSDQEFSLDFKLTKLYLALKNILFSLNTTAISDENFQIIFADPNKIRLEVSEIQGSVSFEDSISLGFLKEQSKVYAELYSFVIKLEFSLDHIESKKNKGKFLPLITLQNIEVNFDFDYNLYGDWLIKILNSQQIKGIVINLIKSQINSVLSASLKKTINQIISSLIENLPASEIIDGKFLSLDYEIISAPKIQNDKFLTINSKALLFNSELQETLNPPFNLTEVPDFNDSNKSLEIMVSEFTINSALYTLWRSGILQMKIDSSRISDEIPFKLNTTVLDIIFNGVSAQYGVDRPIELDCSALDNPMLKFSHENIDFGLNFECKIFVFTNDTQKEQAYWIKSTLGANFKFNLGENGHIYVNMNYAQIENSQMVQTTVEETNIENIQNEINFISNIGMPYINKNYLNNFKLEIPVIKGIDLNNSTIVIKDKYVDFHVTPEVDVLKFLN